MSYRKLLSTSGKAEVFMIRRTVHKYLRASRMFPQVIMKTAEPLPRDSSDLQCKSSEMMRQQRMIMKEAFGTYSLLPNMTRSLEKLHLLIDKEMQSIGAQKINMPCLASKALWERTGRWDDMGAELLTLEDRQGSQLCLAPTHEETVTSIVSTLSPIRRSSLPIKIYQIGRKFRDEMRPKHGLLRCREFEMKDLYTFDEDLESASKTYEEVCEAYSRLFSILGLPHVKVGASSGLMGGSRSQEFHLESDIGEDTLYLCDQCEKAFSKEKIDEGGEILCEVVDCAKKFRQTSGIEVAHCFLLGTKYSDVLMARFTDSEGHSRPLIMGCFGIGVTRLLAASVEVLSTDQHIRWPSLLAPYQVYIIPQKRGYRSEDTDAIAERIQASLASLPGMFREVVLDDRTDYSIGVRVKEAKRAGIPHIVVVGKQALADNPKLEYINVCEDSTEYLSAEDLKERLSHIEVIPV